MRGRRTSVYGEGVVGGGVGEMLTVRICVGALMSEKVEDSDVRLYTRSSTRREPPLEENECGGVVRDLVPSGGARHPRIPSLLLLPPSPGASLCFRTVNPGTYSDQKNPIVRAFLSAPYPFHRLTP